jgi:hypothetical protein
MTVVNVALDIAQFLEAQGLGTVDTDIFVGPSEPYGTGVPGVCIFVTPTGGPAPDDFVGQAATGIRHLRVQVMVRGAPGKFADANTVAQGVRDALHLQMVPDYMKVTLAQEPFLLPSDDTRAYRWAVNFICDRVL